MDLKFCLNKGYTKTIILTVRWFILCGSKMNCGLKVYLVWF